MSSDVASENRYRPGRSGWERSIVAGLFWYVPRAYTVQNARRCGIAERKPSTTRAVNSAGFGAVGVR
jgi:hypothetical protein